MCSRSLDSSGSQKAARDASGNATTPSDPFGFDAESGYYLDRETGASYCQNRYCAPSLGRWLERDPIGIAGGMNQYAYCAGQPVGAVDPEGLCKVELWYHTVGGTNGYHAFIVTTDDKTGEQQYFRGGIHYDWWKGLLLNYESGQYNSKSPHDWLPPGDGNRKNTRLIVHDNKPCKYYADIFNARGRDLDAACDYVVGPANFYPNGGNSNSLAHDLLMHAGLPSPDRHPVWVPWWDSRLRGKSGKG